MLKKIVILDYGLGNLRSVQRGLERAGARVEVSGEPSVVDTASGLVLPGVGAFRDGMDNLGPLARVVLDAVAEGKPLLGVCLGMQMLFEESEEGGLHRGLGLVPGRVIRFPKGDLKVPHMGWNSLEIRGESRLLSGVKNGSFVYFVHSYYAPVSDFVSASCEYGLRFAAVVEKDSVMGTQFHPEKSGEVGLRILSNFVSLC